MARLVRRSAEPSHFHRDALRANLSLLGLVRHMAEMEHAYGSWPWGDDRDFAWVWGDYADDAEDDIDCTTADVDASFARWREEIARTDAAVEACAELGAVGPANGYTLRWNLAKLVGEYARHNGHADVIRERIDGATGE